MKQYNQLSLSFAKRIITLANKKYSRYEIGKETGISKGKIKRCLESSKNHYDKREQTRSIKRSLHLYKIFF